MLFHGFLSVNVGPGIAINGGPDEDAQLGRTMHPQVKPTFGAPRCLSSSRTAVNKTSIWALGGRPLAAPLPRAFSASRSAFSSGESDLPLSQKLHEELKFEQESAAEDAYSPAFLEAFKEDGVWNIDDIAGHDEVALTREFGDEKIRMLFSIADIDSPAEPEFTAEEGEAASETESQDASFPIRTSVTVTKLGKGALSIDAIVQDGAFIVDNISFYKDETLANDVTSEADWKRRGLYIGPQFDHLDVNVQELFERYLEERGINSSLALFIPEYAEYKEQKEYVKWLERVKTFIDV